MEPNELLDRLRQGHTRNVRFADFEQLLEALGFIYRRGANTRGVVTLLFTHSEVPVWCVTPTTR